MPVFLLYIIVALIFVGVLLYVISIIPMDPAISKIIHVLVIVAVAIWVIYLLVGMLPPGHPVFVR